MRCELVRECLDDFVDGTLGTEAAGVQAHLAACPECAALLAELAAADEAAASLPAEAPEGYFEALPARVRAREEHPPVRIDDGRRGDSPLQFPVPGHSSGGREALHLARWYAGFRA